MSGASWRGCEPAQRQRPGLPMAPLGGARRFQDDLSGTEFLHERAMVIGGPAGRPLESTNRSTRTTLGADRAGFLLSKDRRTATLAVRSGAVRGFDALEAIRDALEMGAAEAARLPMLAVESAAYRNSPGPTSGLFRTPPPTPRSARGDRLSCRGCPRQPHTPVARGRPRGTPQEPRCGDAWSAPACHDPWP